MNSYVLLTYEIISIDTLFSFILLDYLLTLCEKEEYCMLF
jgi:hypothetical protein